MMKKRLWAYVAANLVTLLVTISAMIGMGVAYYLEDPRAAIWLFLAGFFDAIDGPIARKLGAQSKFGNVLDAQSDFFAFGVAPGFMLVFLGLLHPAAAFVYVIAIQLRLTRNAVREEDGSRYFVGLAAPDAVYVGILVGLIPGLNYTVGYLVAAALAISPWRFWPKGGRIWKMVTGLVVLVLFLRFFPAAT